MTGHVSDTPASDKRFPEVMNIHQCAAYLGIGEDTLYTYAAKGKIPCFRLGGRRWRFKKSKLDEWMEQLSNCE